jgi:aspartate aminotransferase-like enzyme
MAREILSFVPGPAHVRPDVLRAMATAPRPHRSPEVRAMVRRVQEGLAALLRTRETAFPVLGSGTTALEVALAGVARRRVLVLSGGAFGDRLGRIVAALGLDAEHLAVPPGWPVDADLARRALAQGDFDTVAVAHCETQTGALSDVAAIAAVVAARPGTALVVDAVSSLGGVDLAFDDLGPEAVLVGVSGKALACPPGVSVMAVSAGAAERAAQAERGGFALRLETLVDRARSGETPQTPSTPHLHALDVQLPRILGEGLPARAARHAAMAARVAAWAGERFPVLAREDARSPTVTTLENAVGLDVGALLAAVEARGFRIADGYADLRGATFRIGHMGDVTLAETDALLAALDEALDELGATTGAAS